MKIPVFHDDQHGTAIIVGAAVLNGLKVVGKDIGEGEARRVRRGRGGARLPRPARRAGHAAREHRRDRHRGRRLQGPQGGDGSATRRATRSTTEARTLADVIDGADVFLGLSAGGVLKPEMVATMAARPLILALANPEPEILPGAREGRRSPTPSSRPAAPTTRTRSTTCCASRSSSAARSTSARRRSTREMELAAVRAIAELAQAEQSDIVAIAYGEQDLSFGPEYLIPRPFDPRLIVKIAPAVAKAAMDERRRDAPDRGLRRLPRAAATSSSTTPA